MTVGKAGIGQGIALYAAMLIWVGVASSISTAQAQESNATFCARSLDRMQEEVRNPEMRMGFSNDGGLFDQGTCWWHSRLQRSAFYLVRLRPEKPRPSRDQAERIVADLIAMNRVVDIPGYTSFRDFTHDFRESIQRKLDEWQINDGILKMVWIDGLSGQSELQTARLLEQMDYLYGEVEGRKRIAFARLQIPGIASHAWLVIGMRTRTDGYEMDIIDSNDPRVVRTVIYRWGDRFLPIDENGSVHGVPYLDFVDDMDRIQAARRKYCGSPMPLM